jgi:CheY-like chemotaxis protein
MESVLFVDDEESVRRLAQTVLEQHGYRVLLAASGPEAFDVYGDAKEPIALVVLDLTMPEWSGRETLERLRGLDPDVCILLSSGYTAEYEVDGEKNVVGFLAKPYRPQALAAAVRQAIDAGRRGAVRG